MKGRYATPVTPILAFPHQGGRDQAGPGRAAFANPHPNPLPRLGEGIEVRMRRRVESA